MRPVKPMTGLRSSLLTLLLTAAASPLVAAEPDSTITVTGSASASTRPDTVSLSFGVEADAATAAAALAANSERMHAVVAAMRALGLEEQELATEQFNVQPLYERHQEPASGGWTQKLIGYRVSNILAVGTGRLDRVGEIVDRAVSAGANRVDRIAFQLSPGLREAQQRQLIEAAVQDARTQAELALKPLGQHIAGVRNVALSGPGMPGPVYLEAARMDMAAAPPVFAGEQGVNVTVTVTFLIAAD